MRIASLDHLVLTVASIAATVAFYERLGMRAETFGDGRLALRFGDAEDQPARGRPEFAAACDSAPCRARPTSAS